MRNKYKQQLSDNEKKFQVDIDSNFLKQDVNEHIITELEEKLDDLKNKYADNRVNMEKWIESVRNFGEMTTAIAKDPLMDNILRKSHTFVTSFMELSAYGIGIYKPQNEYVHFPVFIENSKILQPFDSYLNDSTSLAAWVIQYQQPVFSNDYLIEYTKYVSELKLRTSKPPLSLIYIPLTLENHKIGVLTVQSYNRFAYSENEYSMVKTLGAFLSFVLHRLSDDQRYISFTELYLQDAETDIPII